MRIGSVAWLALALVSAPVLAEDVPVGDDPDPAASLGLEVDRWRADPRSPACQAAVAASARVTELERAVRARSLAPPGGARSVELERWAAGELSAYFEAAAADLRALERAVREVHEHGCLLASLDALRALGDAHDAVARRVDDAAPTQDPGCAPDLLASLRWTARRAWLRCHTLAVRERAYTPAVRACLDGLDRTGLDAPPAELVPSGSWRGGGAAPPPPQNAK
ncbi:MAG: hypothetical protein VYE22_06375 [Myxococcota bacterium]|nr:hypothetical protein [Myxococcota bacterium]